MPDQALEHDQMDVAIPSPAAEVFPLVRWDYDAEEMRCILDFEHRLRLSPLLKDLLSLPCMQQSTEVTKAADAVKRCRAQHLLEQDLRVNAWFLAP